MRSVDDRVSLLDGASLSWQARALLIGLIALSFAVRLYDLEGKSLWSDEGLTLRRAEQPLRAVFQNVNLIPNDPDFQNDLRPTTVVSTPDLHPPLYFLLMHVWIRLAGQSEFALRFPSVAAATLALPLFYALGRSLLSHEAGLWAALLSATSPFYLWYAQEARMYTWLVVLSLASVYLFLPLLEDNPRRRDYAVYIAVTLALLYTHYAGFLLLAFEAAVYAVYRLRSRWRGTMTIVAALILITLPLLPFLWRALRVRAFSFTYRPLPVILREAWSAFSLGPTPSAVQPWWRLLPFLILFVVGSFMLDSRHRGRSRVIGLGYLFLPILAQYAMSFIKPNYMNPRHLMVAAPGWELLMAQGLVTLRRRLSSGLVLILGLALLFRGQASFDMFTSHRFWKDDIRGAVEYIEARARPGDAIVLHHPVIRLTFDYYYDGDCPEIAIPRYGNNRDIEQAQATFAEWARRYDRIWFMYGPPPTYFPKDFLPTWADEHLFKLQKRAFEAWWTYVGVAAYQEDEPTLEALPTNAKPLDEAWGALRLVGFRAQNSTAGKNAWVDLYWQAGGQLPDQPLELKLQLQDETGTVWVERIGKALPFYTPAMWPSDQLIHTEFRLPLPEDTPPISYSVSVEPVGLGDQRVIGQMRVDRAVTGDTTPRPVARFENGIELLQVDLEGNTFRAGYPLQGSLTWRANGAPSTDYHLRARLVDQRGQAVTANEQALSAAGFPTSEWLSGDRVGGRLLLPLPADLTNGPYRVEISLIDGESGQVSRVERWFGKREWLAVRTVQVEAWPLVTELPAGIEERVNDVEIAGKVGLQGYDLAREGDMLTLTLYWQAKAPLEQNYHVFVHVAEPGQPPVADGGGVPVDWARPTTSWREGEVIADEYVISLSGVQPDHYHILVGFYDPETGNRPETLVKGRLNEGGYVILEELDVE